MRTRTLSVYLIAAVATVMLVPSLHADWSGGSVELSNYPSDQEQQQIVSDGAGGAIVVWQDEREGTFVYDIFAQRLDSDGNILWDAGGVNISQLGSSQERPVLVPDGAGGAIIAFQSDRTGHWDILAQRIRPNGTLAWPSGGLFVCGESGSQTLPKIVSDDTGGAIITWADNRLGNYDIYAARIDSTGSLPWTANGVAVCTEGSDQTVPEITRDGSSGAIISWIDQRDGNRDIFVQLVLFNGTTGWATNGIQVEFTSDDAFDHRMISDMSGGAIIAWELNSGGTDRNIYAERVLNTGDWVWLPGMGLPVCEEAGNQFDPVIVSDGAGGAIFAWYDDRGASTDIYAQHIDFGGGANWDPGGKPICTAAELQFRTRIVSDGHGGAIILWDDYRAFYNREIYAQKIALNGIIKWPENGMNISAYPTEQGYSRALAMSDGGMIATWLDIRDYTNQKIYAQRFDEHGYWGNPAPVITGASDVPADQGGQVQLTWAPIRMDDYPEELVTHYTIWRSVSAPAAMAAAIPGGSTDGSAEDALFVESPCEIGLDFEGKAWRTDIAFGAAAAWEWVASVDAHYWDEYAYTCGTLYNNSEGDDAMHYFVVTANSADPFIYWDSDPDSAWSIDNLSPCAPLALAGEQSYLPEGLNLTWDPNEEPDLGAYNIYRGSDPTFEPSADNMIGSTCETAAFDPDWSWDSDFCYKVSAVDVNGNESDYAVLCMDQVTGEDPMPVPDVDFLAQNYPNPFNPNTTIAFGLKAGGSVNLSVYDAAGRLVTVLIDESRPAGTYAAVWNGKTRNGTSAASGVYFYKLITEDFERTRKMVLLR
jgi:hypothetical protein